MESGSLSSGPLRAPSARRRRTDRAMRALMWMATGIAIVPLVLVLYYTLKKGSGPSAANSSRPIRPAASSAPRVASRERDPRDDRDRRLRLRGRLAQTVRFFIDVMTGVPSIVFGLSIYLALVLAGTGGSTFAGWKSSAALALLMLPIVTRSSEVALQLVPNTLREAALALGAPRWKVVAGRPAERRLRHRHRRPALDRLRGRRDGAAPFHLDHRQGTTFNLNEPMNSLPAQIFQDLKQPNDELVQRAWGGGDNADRHDPPPDALRESHPTEKPCQREPPEWTVSPPMRPSVPRRRRQAAAWRRGRRRPSPGRHRPPGRVRPAPEGGSSTYGVSTPTTAATTRSRTSACRPRPATSPPSSDRRDAGSRPWSAASTGCTRR